MAYRTERTVQFRDTDAGGIMHFASYFGWMEEAEHEALRSVGLSAMDEVHGVGWPRVSVQCDYAAPIRFEDVVTIEVAVERIGSKSVTYQIGISHDGRDVALGKMTAVCCSLGEDGKIHSVEIPPAVLERLKTI